MYGGFRLRIDLTPSDAEKKGISSLWLISNKWSLSCSHFSFYVLGEVALASNSFYGSTLWPIHLIWPSPLTPDLPDPPPPPVVQNKNGNFVFCRHPSSSWLVSLSCIFGYFCTIYWYYLYSGFWGDWCSKKSHFIKPCLSQKIHCKIITGGFALRCWRSTKILTSHLDLPVVGGGLVELLSQLEAELCVLNGALSLHRHLVTVHWDNSGGLGQVAHFTCSKTNAWRKRQKTNR